MLKYYLTGRLLFPLILFIILLPSSLKAQLEFTGYGATGFMWIDRPLQLGESQHVYYEGKLQAEIKVNKNIEAQIDVRGNSDEDHVFLREFSAKFEYWDKMRLKVGNLKQVFGLEQLINREEYVLIERSFINDQLAEYGYAQRAVSIQLYSRYSEKDNGLPYSYYVSLFKNNSRTFGVTGRGSYHAGDFIYSVNYSYISIGGQLPVKGNGFAADATYETKRMSAGVEVFYVENTELDLRRVALSGEQNIFAGGLKLLGSWKIETGSEIFRDVEPVLLASYFAPDFSNNDIHIIQLVPAVNVYFHKDVRFRVNYSLLLSKTEFNPDYSRLNSRTTLELQVRF